MNYQIDLLNQTPLFAGMKADDIQGMLSCLSARTHTYAKDTYVLTAGDAAEEVGIVLSGSVNIIKEDFWGNRSIIGKVSGGGLFAEAFSCAGTGKLPVSAVTAERATILFINYKKIITTCSSACSFHTRLINNMIGILANKNILLTQKIEHTACRTTREKLLSYLSAQAMKAKGNSFVIPFDRQELADFLFVDRSAMSNTLSKLRDEGVLTFQKNHFTLL